VLAVLVAARGQGGIVRLPLPGRHPVYHLAHPDHVRHVLQDNEANHRRTPFRERLKAVPGEGLVTSEGILWRRQRRLIQLALQAARVRAFVPIMAEAVRELAERWRAVAAAGGSVDVAQEMSDLTLAIIVRTMFGRDQRFAEIGPAVRVAQAHVADRFWALADWPAWVPTPANRRFRRALTVLDAAVDRIVRERRQGRGVVDDLLGRLLAARDEAGGGAMDPRRVRDEVMTMFLAGHETSAVGLTWAWYALARHPDVAERVQAEAAAVLGDRPAQPADLDRLPLARAVLQEAMRLHPPVPWLGRLAAGHDRIGGCAVPAGTLLLVSPYVVQRDARWWSEPERFLPERLLGEASRRPP
jgi:enediyne biosynthesis protein E7